MIIKIYCLQSPSAVTVEMLETWKQELMLDVKKEIAKAKQDIIDGSCFIGC